MLDHNLVMVPEDFFEEFQRVDAAQDEALRAVLVAGYEHAIERGLAPCSALSVILNWASEECARRLVKAREPDAWKSI